MAEIDLIGTKYIINKFIPVLKDIILHKHMHYYFKGGRGSTKSSFIAYAIICLIINNPDVHALCLRKVARTCQDTIFQQIQWWIYKLEINQYFEIHKKYVDPIVYKPTGQQIQFGGLDDPTKYKSFQKKKGYTGITWFEEFDQYSAEEVRNLNQTTMRGKAFWYFYSFNPPISKNNWANQYVDEQSIRDDVLVTSNTYLDVPVDWLGENYFKEAEFLKSVNLRAYEHEYLGVATGTGGDVFENVTVKDMSETVPILWDANGKVLKSLPLVDTFDRIACGIDWGFAVDPFRFVKCHYDKRKHDLYIFDEYSTVQKRNEEVFKELFDIQHKADRNDMITADSADPKSIADFHVYGARIRGAEKGADSVRYGIQWLQGLHRIYIDPVRCPKTYKEFIGYEYPRDKNGDFLSVYPDKNNHSIDAVRYATENIWKRRGA